MQACGRVKGRKSHLNSVAPSHVSAGAGRQESRTAGPGNGKEPQLGHPHSGGGGVRPGRSPGLTAFIAVPAGLTPFSPPAFPSPALESVTLQSGPVPRWEVRLEKETYREGKKE